jgi:hypothetical protein
VTTAPEARVGAAVGFRACGAVAATYEEVGDGKWYRKGRVQARPACRGEAVKTLEGFTVAAEGDWVVRGEAGEQWPVPGNEFAQRYVEFRPPVEAEVRDDNIGETF